MKNAPRKPMDPELEAFLTQGSRPEAATAAVNGFALRAALALAEQEGGSFFFSPYSVLSALGMTYEGAGGTTKDAMEQALGLDEGFHASLGALSRGLKLRMDGDGGRPLFTDANRVWLARDLKLRAGFLGVLRRDYGGGAEQLDFAGAPGKAAKIINQWTAKETHDRIQNLIQDVPGSTRMILTNAVYFKGSWAEPFNEKNTKPEPFHVTDARTKDVPMMKRNAKLRYSEAEGVKCLSLPYAGDAEMLLLLPEQGGMEALLSRLADSGAEALARWRDAATSHQVDLWLPKFKMEERYELNKLLASMGMGAAFTNGADFSAMTKDGEPLKIDSVIHQTFLDVNERETEAAAATSVTMVRATSLPQPRPPAEFHADRPFAFCILDDDTGAVLFMGVQSFE